ncbi:MAG: hypothetical protein LBD58_11280 [Treponema sp.]|jgi:hypothetical protein|nr:hypothetical protein [Treponema sp.]
MVDRILIDTLTLKAHEFVQRWKYKLQKAPQLKRYNKLTGEQLNDHSGIYPVLAHTLDRGLDRSYVGGYFVGLAKKCRKEGYPVSEIVYAVGLAQQTVIEYIMNDFLIDNPLKIYQTMDTINRVADFFFLGCFYITKGFLEATYTEMSGKDAISEELLKKYFKDDFFFKQN